MFKRKEKVLIVIITDSHIHNWDYSLSLFQEIIANHHQITMFIISEYKKTFNQQQLTKQKHLQMIGIKTIPIFKVENLPHIILKNYG